MTTHNEKPNIENSNESEKSAKKFENRINILIYETSKSNKHKATLFDSFKNKLGIIKEVLTENTLTGKEYSYNNFNVNLKAESFEEMQSLILENKSKIFRAMYIAKLKKEKLNEKNITDKNLTDSSSLSNELVENKRVGELENSRKSKSKGNNLSK